MRKLILMVLFLVVTVTNIHAAKHYIYIDKIGKVDVGEEAGHTAKGDVVGIYPFTPQYKPTRAERSRYRIIVTDLTEEEKAQLLEEEKVVAGIDTEGFTRYRTVRARKRKIKYRTLSKSLQESEITRNEIFSKTTVKSKFITAVK